MEDEFTTAPQLTKKRGLVRPSERQLQAALWQAIGVGDVTAAQAVLEAGADPNLSSDGSPNDDLRGGALCVALDQGYSDWWSVSPFPLIELLLRFGADLESGALDGRPALHRAARILPTDAPASEQDRGRCVAALLAHGADVNATDGAGMTPLDHAFLVGNAPAARVLLAHGARLKEMDRHDSGAALGLAVLKGGAAAAVNALLTTHGGGIHVDARDGVGRTALLVAAQTGDAATTRLLLDRGAHVHARMHAEVYDADRNCILLPGRGAMPLHLAAGEGHAEVVRLLIEQGKADLNASTGPGQEATALHLATQAARGPAQFLKERGLETMRVLLDAGAEVHGRTRPLAYSDGDHPGSRAWTLTPLSDAAWIGCAPEVRLLIEYGAADCREALLSAMHATTIDNGYRNLPLLWDAGRRRLDPPLTLVEALPYLNWVALRLLLEGSDHCPPRETDIDVNEAYARAGDGETPLLWVIRHLGATYGPLGYREYAYDERSVEQLLRHGANPDVLDFMRRTPRDIVRERAAALVYCDALLDKAAASHET
jgi:ankyrin repeat protein